MTRINFITTLGETKSIDISDGESIMQGALHNGIDGIVGECGGNAMCATCHVYVNPADFERLLPMDPGEDALLDGVTSGRKQNSRLSCQIVVSPEFDGLTVRLPEKQI